MDGIAWCMPDISKYSYSRNSCGKYIEVGTRKHCCLCHAIQYLCSNWEMKWKKMFWTWMNHEKHFEGSQVWYQWSERLFRSPVIPDTNPGRAMGESFRDHGTYALIIYDDPSKYALACLSKHCILSQYTVHVVNIHVYFLCMLGRAARDSDPCSPRIPSQKSCSCS